MNQTLGDHNIFGQPLTEEVRKHKRIFISHRQYDKAVAHEVARYFEFLELHYYLDEEDEGNRLAPHENSHAPPGEG